MLRGRPFARRYGAGAGLVPPLAVVKSLTAGAYWEADFGFSGGSWTDQTGNGNHLIQVTPGAQPVLAADATLNNQLALTFDGIDDEMACALAMPAPGTTPCFWWFVFKQLNWTVNFAPFTGTGGGGVRTLLQSNISPRLRQANNTGVNQVTTLNLNTWARGEALFTNSAVDYLKLRATSVSGGTAGNLAQTGFVIGSVGGTAFVNVAVAAFGIWFGGQPTDSEKSGLNMYVSRKYGSALV